MPVLPMAMPRALVVVGGAATAVVVAAGLQAAAWLVGPVFLALVVVITIDPVRRRLLGLGLPAWAATSLVVAIVAAATIALAGLVLVAVAQLVTILPAYAYAYAYADEANAVVASGTAAVLFVMARREQGRRVFGPAELALFVVAVVLAVLGIVGLATGFIAI